jgi:hypothetical protein
VELDRDKIAQQVRTIMRKHLAIWRGENREAAESLGFMLTELMFYVAVVSRQRGPEQAVHAGMNLLRTWED